MGVCKSILMIQRIAIRKATKVTLTSLDFVSDILKTRPRSIHSLVSK